MYFSCKCNVSKILALVVILKFEVKESLCMHVCMPMAWESEPNGWSAVRYRYKQDGIHTMS